ncbi:MAG: cytochrome c [Bacteroidota bacterium]
MSRCISILAGSLLWCCLLACNEESQGRAEANKVAEPTELSPESTETDAAQAVAVVAPEIMAQGEAVYLKNCLACHQKGGGGVPHLNPPLVGTDWVTGDKTRLIGVVLNGLNEEIEVDGEYYQNVMASFAHLSDEELAAVLTYIRNSWGNEAEPVSPEEVAREREI